MYDTEYQFNYMIQYFVTKWFSKVEDGGSNHSTLTGGGLAPQNYFYRIHNLFMYPRVMNGIANGLACSNRTIMHNNT